MYIDSMTGCFIYLPFAEQLVSTWSAIQVFEIYGLSTDSTFRKLRRGLVEEMFGFEIEGFTLKKSFIERATHRLCYNAKEEE